MKRSSAILMFCLLITGCATAQTDTAAAFAKNRAYTGAQPTLNNYRVIYQLDSNDPKIIEKAFHNINNALTDPRLKGKVEIEVITFSGGTDIILKGSKYENDLKALVANGVIVAQCNNSLHQRNLTRDAILDFVAVVPSANGELIIRQGEGWGVIKP